MKKYILDSSHSEVGFKIKHLMISTVRGYFNKFDATVDGEMDKLNISFTISTSSINTNDETRDQHLKSSEFLNSEEFPEIKFESKGQNVYNKAITGDLTIKGITKTITLLCYYNGLTIDPWGNKKHGFEITGTINRSEFDVSWNVALEMGGLLISDEVRLNIGVQLKEVDEEN